MTQPKTPIQIKRVAIAAHPQVAEAQEFSQAIVDFLATRIAACDYGLLYDPVLRKAVEAGEYDLLITLGGDGTVLRAGHLCGPPNVPILGINLGHFGFLVEVERNGWQAGLERLLAGDFWMEDRMMLEAEIWRDDQTLGCWQVLNEALVGRGEKVRPVRLETHVDGIFLTTYVADGLIVATPTGSTAYALAVGGPVLPPTLRNILIIPVAPHLSFDRAIVLSEGSAVSVRVFSDHQAILCVDGQDPIHLENGDRVTVRASQHTVRFVRFHEPDYFYRNLTSHMNQNPTAGARK